MIKIRSGTTGRITLAFPYDPNYLAKIKTIKDHRWHPEEKYWSFPYSKWALTEILSVFTEEDLDIDPPLQALIAENQKGKFANNRIWAKDLLLTESKEARREKPEWESTFSEKRNDLLFERVREIIRLKHYSIRTEQTYFSWIKRYILFHNNRHPKDMENVEIEAFLSHLAVDLKVSAATQNQPFN